MSGRPHIVWHMIVSLDGRIHPSAARLSLLGAETLAHGLVHLRYRVDRS